MVFLISILWCSWNGNHPQRDLVRFGYKLDMKNRKKPESFYILGYLMELIIKVWEFGIFLINVTNLGHFFPWKILCIAWNHIFQVEIWRQFIFLSLFFFSLDFLSSLFFCSLDFLLNFLVFFYLIVPKEGQSYVDSFWAMRA